MKFKKKQEKYKTKETMKKMGLKKRNLTTTKGIFKQAANKFKDLDQDNKMKAFAMTWEGVPGIPSPGKQYKKAWEIIKKTKQTIKKRKATTLKKEKKFLLKLYPVKGLGLDKETKKTNKTFKKIIINLYENIENEYFIPENNEWIKELEKDLTESEEREKLELMKKLQMVPKQSKPKVLKIT